MTGNTEQTGNTPQPTAAAEPEIPASVQKTIEAKDNEINELKAQLETEQAEKRKSEYTQFAEQLIKDGKLAPSQKSVVVDLMEVCGRAGSYDFAEGDEKSVLNRFKTFLNNSKHVEFAEIANAGNTGTIQRNVIDFSDGASIAKAIEQKRTEYEKQGIEKSEAQILNELKKGQQN